MYDNERKKIELLRQKVSDIEAQAQNEKRELFKVERDLVNELRAEANHIELSLPEKPLTVQNGTLGGAYTSGIRKDGGHALIGPNEKKDYKALFGNGGYQWPDKETNFFAAALSGRHHPGLIMNSMSETVPSDGGFLVPS